MDPIALYHILTPQWQPLLPLMALLIIPLTNVARALLLLVPTVTDEKLAGQAPAIGLGVALPLGLLMAAFIAEPPVSGLVAGVASWFAAVAVHTTLTSPARARAKRARARPIPTT